MSSSEKSPIFDKRLTIGNIITIVTLVVSFIVTISVYKSTIDLHTDKLHEIEQNQAILEKRIQLLEAEMNVKQTRLENLEQKVDRTNRYMELLLDKEGIQYVQ